MPRILRYRKRNRKRDAYSAAAVLSVAAVFAVPATAASAAPHVNWTARTCSAFHAYEQHPNRANLDTLITDSLHVPWSVPGKKYGLGSDVYGLGSDVFSGKSQYVAKDAGYISKDGC